MDRTIFVLVSLLCSILQCNCYGPVSQNSVSLPVSQSENSVLNFGSGSDYGYSKPVAVINEGTKSSGGYWWVNKQSPFVATATAEVPVKQSIVPASNEITGIKYETNPFLNSFAKENSCNGYDCVAKIPCVEEGYICAPQYLCQNGVISKDKLSLITEPAKFCVASKDVCCKISYQSEGGEVYEQKPTYTKFTSGVPSYSQTPVAVSVISSSGYSNPEYASSNSIAPTPAPTPAPYTGPLNTTPYPGCAAALKCVPDNYCTLEGVMSDIPVVLTKELLLSRVPLSECTDPATGIIGKCCRDPNYKDPWPDHDSHDHGHGHGHDHSHEHTEHTEAPQTHYTLKKPIGGYQIKPASFPDTNVQSPTTDRVISLQSYSPSTEASKPVPSYFGSAQDSGYQYQSSQVYIPPAQTYIPPVQSTYAPPPQSSYIPPPKPTYVPPPQSSYIPPPQPTYVPPPQSSYIPPPKPTYVPPPQNSYIPPPKPTYVPPPQSSYIPPPQPTYVPPPQSSYIPPPKPTYVPPPQSSYIPPPQPTYAPPPPSSYIPPPQPTYAPPPPSSYIPPPKPTYVPPPQSSYIPPPQPTYVPPQSSYIPPQTVVNYVPPKQPVAPYVPPQPQSVDVTYYKPATVAISRQPLDIPLVIASDRVFEKSSVAPIAEKQEYYSQCGAKLNDGTEYGEAPWHAVVYSSKSKDLSCGGVIVSENAILTSAHCVEKADTESLYVKVGPAEQIYNVAALARHPDYDSASLSKDLALAILKEPIKFDSYTQKICLPPPQSQIQSYNKECYVTTLSDYFNPGTLQKIKIQTFPYNDCEIRLRNTYLGKYFKLQDTFTCASTPSESELCQIKSGEPVACDRGDGIYELYGIKSWDLGCQEYKKSAIFSNNDVLWIENTLVAPLQKLITDEKIYQKEKFKGETLEGVNIQEKPGFALGYGK